MSTGSRRRSRGFTLVEALVATVLVGVGVTSVMNGFASLTKSEAITRESERMQRLAMDKYDEVVATGEAATQGGESGNFQDRGEDRYSWKVDVQPSTETNLNVVTVTVTPTNGNSNRDAVVDGLVFVQPAATAAGGTP